MVIRAPVRARASILAGALPGPERRVREVRAGRACAAEALRDAGATDLHVGVSEDRSPQWPAGFVGSITHTTTPSGTFACAAAVRRDQLRSIGIDSEAVLNEKTMHEVLPSVLDPAERAMAASCRAATPCAIATLAFSAKESLYKCLYPCARVFFYFADAELEWIRGEGDGASAK
jgi:enterobactin synthetase component D